MRILKDLMDYSVRSRIQHNLTKEEIMTGVLKHTIMKELMIDELVINVDCVIRMNDCVYGGDRQPVVCDETIMGLRTVKYVLDNKYISEDEAAEYIATQICKRLKGKNTLLYKVMSSCLENYDEKGYKKQ